MEEIEELGKNEKKKEKPKPAENTGEGSEPKTNTLVDDTNLAAKRMEDATKAAKEERLAREESYSKMKLSGDTDAGQAPVKKSEDEEWAEGAKKRYEGTGMDPTPDDTPTTFI